MIIIIIIINWKSLFVINVVIWILHQLLPGPPKLLSTCSSTLSQPQVATDPSSQYFLVWTDQVK